LHVYRFLEKSLSKLLVIAGGYIVTERSVVLTVFLALFAFTVVCVIGANVGWFGQAAITSALATWGLAAVIGELVAGTVYMAKSYYPQNRMKISLDFMPLDSGAVDLDADNCKFEIREDGNFVSSGKVAVAFTKGGWECALPANLTPDQVVTLKLCERQGKKWEVKSFYPYYQTLRVHQVSEGGIA
jgi:hypothetical protein